MRGRCRMTWPLAPKPCCCCVLPKRRLHRWRLRAMLRCSSGSGRPSPFCKVACLNVCGWSSCRSSNSCRWSRLAHLRLALLSSVSCSLSKASRIRSPGIDITSPRKNVIRGRESRQDEALPDCRQAKAAGVRNTHCTKKEHAKETGNMEQSKHVGNRLPPGSDCPSEKKTSAPEERPPYQCGCLMDKLYNYCYG